MSSKIKNLSREEKEKLYLAILEKKRRLKKKKAPFIPNPGQEKLLKDSTFIRVCTAGNSGGKSVAAVVNAVWAAQGLNPLNGHRYKTPNQNIVLLDRPSKVTDKWIPEAKKFFDTSDWAMPKDGTPTVRRWVLPNGSEVIFLFQEMNEQAFESIDGGGLPGGIATVTIDEPCPRWQWVALRRGGRTKGANTKYMIIGTPIGNNSAWMRQELFEQWKQGDTDIAVHNYSSFENEKNLDEGYLEKFSKALTEKEKQIRLHGQWSDLDGLALAHLWDEKVHVGDFLSLWDPSNPCVVAIDPHPSKKHVAVLLGADRHNRLYVLKELQLKELARDFARSLKKWMEGFRVIDIVSDSLGSAEMTGGEGFLSFIEVLKDCGVRVRPTRYDEKVDADWITRLQDALLIPTTPDQFGKQIPKLRVDMTCRLVISDIKNVQWIKVRNVDEYKPTLDISNKDGLSCVKYALATDLFFDKPNATRPSYRTGNLYNVTTGRRPQPISLRAALKRR